MAIEYPSQLPYPLRQDYGMQTTSPLQRTEMDSGRSRSRRRFSSVPTIVTASWLMTEAQAQIFEAWFAYDVMDGAAWFDCPLKTPTGLKPYEARFVDVYTGPSLVGRSLWRYSARIELRNRPILTEDEYAETIIYLEYLGPVDRSLNEVWPKAAN